MAIPAPTFYHKFGSLTPNYPTSGLTPSNPSGMSDPGVSGGEGTFNSNNKGKTWVRSSGNFLTGGTADWTIAVRMKITADAQNNVILKVGNEGSRNLTLAVYSAVSDRLHVINTTNSAHIVATGTYVAGTYAVYVFRRSGTTGSAWKDGTSGTDNDDVGTTSMNLTATPYQSVTLGVNDDGTDPMDGVVDWVAIFDSAVSDADIPNLNETNIDATLSADTTAPTYGANPHTTQLAATTVTVAATASDETDTAVDHYMGVYLSGNTPTAANIKAGTGTGFTASKSALNVANGVEAAFSQVTGLASATAYDVWATVEEHGSTKNPRAPYQVAFTTLAALSSPAGTPDTTTGSTGNTADLSVSTTGGSGTLYWYLSTSATPPSVANLKAGTGSNAFGSQAVSGTGSQTMNNKGTLAEKTSYYAHFLHTFASQDSAIATSSAIAVPTDAPTISAGSPTTNVTSDSTATLSVATSRTTGTMWVVVTTSVTQPSTAQIKAGQNNAGGAAAYAASDASVSNPQSFSATGLTPATGYYAHFYQEDGESDGSNRFTSNSFTTTASGAYNVDAFSPGVIRPGDVVTATLSGSWSAGSKTATINGHPVTLSSQSAAQCQFTCPTFHTNPSFNDTQYATAVQFVLTDGGFQGSKNITVAAPSGYDFLSINSVAGIWVNDTGAAINDSHLGHWTAGSADPISSDGILSHITTLPATYEYWRFDKSENLWTAAANEVFYESIAFSGSAYTAKQYYEGAAISAFDGSAGFNAATASISAYAEVGQAVPGLSLNTSNGSLTGTPTTQGAYAYTIRGTDADGNIAFSNAFTITVYEAPVWASTPDPQTWMDGQTVLLDLSLYINANAYGPAASWSKLAGTLVTGVTLNTSTGRLSGTVNANASVSSPYTGWQFRATNTSGNGDSGTFNVTVNPIVPVFIGGNIANISGLVGGNPMGTVDVSSHFPANGQTYAFVGTVPGGISINSSSGVISGTPVAPYGTFSVQVRATNVSGNVSSNSFTISSADAVATFTGNIADIGPLSINVAMTPVDVSGQFGGGAATGYSVSSAAQFHPGITISSVGVISGTPTVVGNRIGLKVRKTNSGGYADSNSFAINVVGGTPVNSTPLPNRQNYITDNVGSIDFKTYFTGAVSVAVTVLPDGLTDTAGVVTGTVTTVQSKTVVVTATNASGNTVVTFTWDVVTLVPVLSLPLVYPKATSAVVRATTSRIGGTLYYVVTTSVTQPSAAQIKNGLNNLGAAAVSSGSASPTYIGEQSFNATGLSALTTYYTHYIHEGAGAVGDSNRLSSAAWATTSGVGGGGPRWFDF